MFRSKRRAVVYPQAEHARMAGAIAAVWPISKIPVPFASFVAGVTLHDRGYGELDDDELLAIAPGRWAEIQTRGFRERSGDPVADVIVALHIRRLIGDDTEPARAALAREIDAALPALKARVDVGEEAWRAADAVTELCDMLAFAFCFEEESDGCAAGVEFHFDGDDTLTLAPWPLDVGVLRGVVRGFSADEYPERLVPIVATYTLQPA